MKKSEWNEALNHIDDDIVANFVAQKENLQKKKKMRAVYIRLVAISACLAIIFTAVFTVPMLVERGDGGLFWDGSQINGSDGVNSSPSYNDGYGQPSDEYGIESSTGDVFDYDFHAYLDSIPFEERMGERLLTEIVSRYKYEGKSITSMMLGAYFDGIDGGGYESFHRDGLFSYSSTATFYDDEGYVIYSQDFSTCVQLEGLALPRGIVFEDSIIDVLKKLKIDLYSGKYNSTYEDGNLTIYESENESFKLQRTDDNGYSLVYTENYLASRDNKSVVTRKLSMFFDSDNDYKLSNFYICADEKSDWGYTEEEKYKIKFADTYEILNEMKDSYAPGEKVTVKLKAIDGYYDFYVNSVRQAYDESTSEYLAYTFVMPAEDVTIDIKLWYSVTPIPPQDVESAIELKVENEVAYFNQLDSTSAIMRVDDRRVLIEDPTFVRKLGAAINGKSTTNCDCAPIYYVEIDGHFFYFHSHGIAFDIVNEEYSSPGHSSVSVTVYTVECTEEEMNELFAILDAVNQSSV